jgi:hypothetical protein
MDRRHGIESHIENIARAMQTLAIQFRELFICRIAQAIEGRQNEAIQLERLGFHVGCVSPQFLVLPHLHYCSFNSIRTAPSAPPLVARSVRNTRSGGTAVFVSIAACTVSARLRSSAAR